MIRFSAALVAVAIGVLIGGIATSKLLLVYIAIVVSAVALAGTRHRSGDQARGAFRGGTGTRARWRGRGTWAAGSHR